MVLLAGLLWAAMAWAEAPRYHVVDLGHFSPQAINTRGELVGGTPQGAARWTAHGLEPLESGLIAYDLREDRRAVGQTASGAPPLWMPDGTLRILPSRPDAAFTVMRGINARGYPRPPAAFSAYAEPTLGCPA